MGVLRWAAAVCCVAVSFVVTALSYAANLYDFEWTPAIPGRVDPDAVRAALLLTVVGLFYGALGLALLWKPRGILVLPGVILVLNLFRLPTLIALL